MTKKIFIPVPTVGDIDDLFVGVYYSCSTFEQHLETEEFKRLMEISSQTGWDDML